MPGVHGPTLRAATTDQEPTLFEVPAELEAYRSLINRLRDGQPVTEDASRLVDEALIASARPGFDVLVSLPRLRFSPFPHQVQAACRTLSRLRGRAILADEVGLGKTIEAGLVLSELFLRRLARRTLIMVPAGLVEQWAEELDQKFALPVLVHGGDAWGRRLHPWDAPIIVASLATIRREPWRATVLRTAWDLVIFDEAHRLKNPNSSSAKLAKHLRAVRLLLLTATPVENRIDDLFQLVNLVRPGHLGTLQQFRGKHASRGLPGPAPQGMPSLREIDMLQARMRDVMIRHRRSEVALMLPRRLAETVRVTPCESEAALYSRISEGVRKAGRSAAPSMLLTLRSLQRLAGSSPQAVAPALERLGWSDLALLAAEVPPLTEKTRTLLDVLARHRARDEKVVVFTAFRQTLSYLADRLAQSGMHAVRYHGGLGRREKNDVMRAFAQDAPLLLTTEAAGEGRNLQFCHAMVNFDLPWNPMQIEQRLGRIHRIGQTNDVLLTNLVSAGTIEDRILAVLEAKINLFELVVGELDMILGRIDDDFDFENSVFDAHLESESNEEFASRMHVLGERIADARAAYLESRSANDDLMPAAQA